MQPSTLLLPAAFATNYHPPPPPPPLLLLPSHRRLHCHHHGQTHRRPLPKKEATAAAPPAYQRQHQHENVYKSRWLGLIYLIYSIWRVQCRSREFSNYQVVSFKKNVPFLQSTYSKMHCLTYLGGGAHPRMEKGNPCFVIGKIWQRNLSVCWGCVRGISVFSSKKLIFLPKTLIFLLKKSDFLVKKINFLDNFTVKLRVSHTR